MNYQVWTAEEFGDTYKKVDCGDLAAVKRELDAAVRAGKEPILTVEVPYEIGIKISEVGSEAVKSKSKHDKDTRAESESKVRPGDTEPVQE